MFNVITLCPLRATLIEELAKNDKQGNAQLVPVLKEHAEACNVARQLVAEGKAEIEHSENLVLWVRRVDTTTSTAAIAA